MTQRAGQGRIHIVIGMITPDQRPVIVDRMPHMTDAAQHHASVSGKLLQRCSG
jgi:hypothetical protein